MPAPYNVPLSRIPLQPAQAQTLRVNLNGTDYRLRLTWNDADEGTWILDIGDEGGVPILCGIPLLPGQNLLAQYDHLQIGGGGALFIYGAGQSFDPPTFKGLGNGWELYFAPPTSFSAGGIGLSIVPDGLLALTSTAGALQTRGA